MEKYKNKIKEWIIKNSDKKIARVVLRLVAFTESSFFPIPPDPFLGALIILKPKKWLVLSLNVVGYSVMGGILGYFLGFWFFDLFGPKIISFYGLADEFVLVEQFFSTHAFWSIFISAFTPIPYKIFTIGAGLFHVNFLLFVIASILGRGLRFLVVGFIFRYIGEKYSHLIFKYFNLLTLLFGLLIIIYLFIKFI